MYSTRITPTQVLYCTPAAGYIMVMAGYYGIHVLCTVLYCTLLYSLFLCVSQSIPMNYTNQVTVPGAGVKNRYGILPSTHAFLSCRANATSDETIFSSSPNVIYSFHIHIIKHFSSLTTLFTLQFLDFELLI